MVKAAVKLLIMTSLIAPSVHGGVFDNLKSTLLNRDSEASSQASLADLTSEEMVTGLKDALAAGARVAVNELGRNNGFLENDDVKIRLPESLEPVEKTLNALGRGQYAEHFVVSMNRAAERAVPMAADVFAKAIREMTIDDARAVLEGGDTAATDFLRSRTENSLREGFRPLVDEAIHQVGVTSTYQRFVGGSGLLSGALDSNPLDLTRYVTEQALDGVFYIIAEQEEAIRDDPVNRTTELLKKVFGAAD